MILGSDGYRPPQTSLVFPLLDTREIVRFLNRRDDVIESVLIPEFRDWVAQSMESGDSPITPPSTDR